MSDYTKSTNFATKDALPSGDPLKIVKGTEIDTEFNNIATAIATKADLISPVFTGTPTLPTGTIGTTQSAGNNSTALATTAFVTAALQSVYPVGSIYINAGVTTNPATLLGFGTWTAFGAGRVMVGLNASDALFDTLEETGGSKDAIVVSHSHTASSSSSSSFSGNALPTHAHTIGTGTDGASPGFGNTLAANTTLSTSSVSAGTPSGSVSTSTSTTVNSTGSSGTNANLQPYITVAMWKRTA
jgi:hypothetical protein